MNGPTILRHAVLALGLLTAAFVLAPCAPAQMRVFTDTEGRTINAELTGSTETTVRIRRDDGRSFEIEKQRLSASDLEFIAAWELKRAFAFGGIEIAARRVRLDAERTQTRSSQKKDETWCYKFTVKNASRARLEGLVAEWRVFFVDDTAKADKDELPLKRKQGRSAIGLLEPDASIELQTTPVDLHITQLKPGYHYTDTNRRRIEDSLEGVWVRIVRGREVLAEFSNPKSLPDQEAW